MKPVYALLLALIISGCLKPREVEIRGIASGIKSGTVLIKNENDSTIYGVNIKNGQFYIHKQFETPGYFKLAISIDGKTDSIKPFEIYLEDGKYNFEADGSKLNQYPKIFSASKIQGQLSTFYALAYKANNEAQIKADELREQIRIKSTILSTEDFNKLLMETSAANRKIPSANLIAFKEYIKENPDNDISIHLMDELHYFSDPESYYAIYKSLPEAMRNSEQGKYIGEQLSRMVKLLPGATAPEIYGKTPDGKPFDSKSISQKLILVEFWQTGSTLCRTNHQKLAIFLSDPQNAKRLNIVSVSLDQNPEIWTNAIKDDGMTWMQVSDLKGNSSPNVTNWMVRQYPAYYLVDNQWHIVQSNLLFSNIDLSLMSYLQNHP